MVQVPGGYRVDSTEVTNAQYAAFLAVNPSTGGQDAWCSWNGSYLPSSGWPGTGKDGYPVVHVDWCDAYAYCKWAGKRLCGKIGGGPNSFADYADATKSQWYTACSAAGTQAYPYGATYSRSACNGFHKGVGATLPVGSQDTCEGGYPGIYDLSGNVWEWEDSCDGTEGSSDSCRARGGSFVNDYAFDFACDYDSIDKRNGSYHTVGFRCCGP